MSRISYRCLPDERQVPIAEKTQWDVYNDKRCVGCIKAIDTAKIRSHNLRIWQPVLYEESFNPIEFPHVDVADEIDNLNEPFVVTNDEQDHEHNLELHHPSLMTMYEARQWIRSIVKGE